MRIYFGFSRNDIDKMLLVGLSSFNDLQSFFATAQVPRIGMHSYYRITKLQRLIAIIMETVKNVLTHKYPVLQYFQLAGVSDDELEVLATEIHLDMRTMSSESKKIMKKVKLFANGAESKLKSAKKLYKFLEKKQDFITQIIMNNQKIQSLEALCGHQFSQVQILQFNNNEITSLQPLVQLTVPCIEELDLSFNFIYSLGPLERIDWHKLRNLSLSHNNIQTIEAIPFSKFAQLKHLNLSQNFIHQVKYLRKEFGGDVKQLKYLDLSKNLISNIRWLSECQFIKLNHLNLNNNPYPDFMAVQKIQLNQSKFKMNWTHSSYQIQACSPWERGKGYLFQYRQLSKHKTSIKITAFEQKFNRQNIQKKRKLILE